MARALRAIGTKVFSPGGIIPSELLARLLETGFSEPVSAASAGPVTHLPTPDASTTTAGAVALAIHTGSYFAVMAAVAWIVYSNVGLAFLRTAWFDMDRVWACSLLITGSVVLVW